MKYPVLSSESARILEYTKWAAFLVPTKVSNTNALTCLNAPVAHHFYQLSADHPSLLFRTPGYRAVPSSERVVCRVPAVKAVALKRRIILIRRPLQPDDRSSKHFLSISLLSRRSSRCLLSPYLKKAPRASPLPYQGSLPGICKTIYRFNMLYYANRWAPGALLPPKPRRANLLLFHISLLFLVFFLLFFVCCCQLLHMFSSCRMDHIHQTSPSCESKRRAEADVLTSAPECAR